MAFRGVLPEVPSFGTQLARGLGGGLSQGIQQAGQLLTQSALEKMKLSQKQKLINSIENGGMGQGDQSTQVSEEQFLSALPQIEQALGRDLTPQDLNQLWEGLQGQQTQETQEKAEEDPFLKAKQYIAADLDPRAALAEAKMKSHQKYEREKEERSLIGKGAETFWKEIADTREKLPFLQSSLDAQMDAVLKGDVDPFSRGHIADVAKSLGAPSSLVAALETPGSKEFKTGLKTYLSNSLKEAFRGTTTSKEIELIEGLLAQAGATQEGNLASIWLLQSQLMLQQEKIRLASSLRKQGVSGYEIPDIVDAQLDPFRKNLSDQYIQAIDHLRNKK
jgi:hypothetical protein